MAKLKFPSIDEIAWGKIQEIRVSSNKQSFSFEFDLHGRRQKMTITISPDSTSYTLSDDDGTPLLHGIQKGREFRVIDFSPKAQSIAEKKIKGMGKIKKK
ncbi:MAG: hypothetical protein N3E51_00430 [Candidatus Micrarchaeota archaeon]|nr:hypothetical protein [Candidatus Micrarchaeota archaeon]